MRGLLRIFFFSAEVMSTISHPYIAVSDQEFDDAEVVGARQASWHEGPIQ